MSGGERAGGEPKEVQSDGVWKEGERTEDGSGVRRKLRR